MDKTRYHRDLDGDGQDEILVEKPVGGEKGGPSSFEALKIQTQAGQVISQTNFAGEVAGKVQFVDLGDDGLLETIVPVLRRDSLFLVLLDTRGRKQKTLYLTSGDPRKEPEGRLPWDPQVRGAHLADVNEDGQEELVTVMVTRLARRPRGVWVHDLGTGERLGRWTTGAMIDHFVVEDLAGGDAPELLAATGASNNGARVGGMDDQHAYLFLLDLPPQPDLIWKRQLGGLWATTFLRAGHVDADGQKDYFVLRRVARQRPKPARLEQIDPASGRPLHVRELDASAHKLIVSDIDGTGRAEILVSRATGTVCQFGPDLRRRRCRQLAEEARGMSVVSGVVRPGARNVVLTGESTSLLGPDMRPIAVLPALAPRRWSVLQRGNGRRAQLVGQTSSGTAYVRLAENEAYLLYRWGPWALLLLGLGTVVGTGVWARRAYRRYQGLRKERIELLEGEDEACILARPDGTIEWANENARSLLGISDRRPTATLLQREVPGLAKLLDRIGNGSAEDVPLGADASALDTNGEGRPVEARAEPLGEEDPSTWLIRLADESPAETGQGPSYRAWSLLARRVAHDLKNPLTSILLLVERLREETEQSAPALAEEIGGYADRIEQRVQTLRRMTTNFMKFVGDEEPSLVRADLQAFVKECAEELRRDLPADIDLALETGEALPAAKFDQGQMHSVLENLVANAMEALPEGGTITLSLRVEQGLRWHPTEEPKDYLALEVRDTGVGMDPETRARLFEPGHTTSEEGAGLGLVIVKKVAEDHGGHLEVESEEGVGTAVTVYLPAAGEASRQEAVSEKTVR